jgi:ribosome-binding factor A
MCPLTNANERLIWIHMPTRRQRRVAELLHRELSLIFLHEMRDPRVSDVTITAVEVTQDLLIARVFVTILGSDGEEQEALAALDHAKGFLRTQLAGRIELRMVPELEFRLDPSVAYAQRIEQLLDQLDLDDLPPDENEPS